MWKRRRGLQSAVRSWDQQAEIARLEQEWCWADSAQAVDVPDGLLASFKDRPESRTMTPTLLAAAAHGRDKHWAAALPVFQDLQAANRDYDVPYVWFADFLKSSGHTDSAITLLKHAIPLCNRKSALLRLAGEFSLFNGSARDAFHLFAQSISASPEPPAFREVGRQRTFLFIAELFDVFGDTTGTEWAVRMAQDFTRLDAPYIKRIRDAAGAIKEPEYAVLLTEVPMISAALRGVHPRRSSNRPRARRPDQR